MSVEDRPRERLCNLGAQALSNAELLAILIGSGTKERSALRIAEEMTCGEGLYRQVARWRRVQEFSQFLLEFLPRALPQLLQLLAPRSLLRVPVLNT